MQVIAAMIDCVQQILVLQRPNGFPSACDISSVASSIARRHFNLTPSKTELEREICKLVGPQGSALTVRPPNN